MNLNSKILIPNTLFSQEVDDETIVLDTDTQEYFNFTGIGKVIWDMLLEEKSLNQIHKELLELFDVEADQLNKDIINFLTSLYTNKLIKVID